MQVKEQTQSTKALPQERDRIKTTRLIFPQLKILYIVVLFSFFLFRNSASIYAQHVTVGYVAEDEFVRSCIQDMGNADKSGDGSLNATEFLKLLEGKTGQPHDEFGDLDVRLILLYHLTACSCMNKPNQTYDCCYGSNSKIDFGGKNNTNPDPEIIEFCQDIDDLIGDIYTSTPSSMPSVVPAPTPTPGTPTLTPTSAPTGAPTPGTPTLAPTSAPTGTPGAPTGTPTPAPTPTPGAPTLAPTSAPTGAPTPGAPTLAPTSAPTGTPGAPTGAPTPAPTPTPGAPTLAPTSPTTGAPTPGTPNLAPTPVPSMTPSQDRCYPISYHFNIENDMGLDAHKIDNAINNTLKVDLINATKYSVIETLNTTYPRSASAQSSTITNIFTIQRFLEFVYKENKGHDLIPLDQGGNKLRNLYSTERRNDRYFRRSSVRMLNTNQLQRRLVYFTEELPIGVEHIADNPFCAGARPIHCVMMQFRICIVLEDGDNAGQIRRSIIRNLRTGIPKYLVGY